MLDQAIRIMQAMIDLCADQGWLSTVLQIIMLLQMVVQGRWYYDSPLLLLPGVTEEKLKYFKSKPKMKYVCSLRQLIINFREHLYMHTLSYQVWRGNTLRLISRNNH